MQPGDYLSKIAQQCDVTYSALLAANLQITDPNLIYPNQEINIPNGSTGNNGGVPVTGGSVYVIQPGDSRSSIANRFGVSLNSLISANTWLTNPGLIYPGLALSLPQGAERIPTVTVTPSFGRIGTTVTLAATGF